MMRMMRKQKFQTPAPIDAVARTGKRSKITKADLQNMAELVAKRLTEVEACAVLNIRARSWYNWKSRHKNQTEFGELLARVRGAYLQAHLKNIEAAGVGEGPHKRADWRASDRLLALAAPERFAASQQSPEPPAAAGPVVGLEIFERWVKIADREIAAEGKASALGNNDYLDLLPAPPASRPAAKPTEAEPPRPPTKKP